ncbi:ABC transporter permease [Nitratidesulfovibrio vulgaris]|uniref:Binding-protein-dependent transport systems inner membrane component n=1 Tax=Nitratidesulfovibrio vulgaris (strain DP4) TaxID=391774 RepID=A0A0H3A759_NITV4|nr:ABC transporter permease [Nitratidesulfovibrio vulgaris]ABM27864.1 binding-protein-dependent transport systems inner membrane component [Nitratidesulfovibrio vulgaris DP4]GEB81070.1 ABC transporter permease [Desulfovibrio desulfuricans]
MTTAQRRWNAFRRNGRAWWSLVFFVTLFCLSLCAEIIANDRPLLVMVHGRLHSPVLHDYTERDFGGEFDTPADFRDPLLTAYIDAHGWALWPPVRFADATINYDAPAVPAPPGGGNWLGTDDQGRDILARLLYGFRLSVLFGLALTLAGSVTGIAAGAVMGYRGGRLDLFGQRILEIWSGIPVLYLLMLVGSMFRMTFWSLLGVMLLFGWMRLVPAVRTEFLRGRNLDHVRAARALGVPQWRIMLRHVLPNAMVAVVTFLPFQLNGSIVALTSLDFLGFGLPPGYPSLGELVAQGRANLHAPWIGCSVFGLLGGTLMLLVFIGEGVRDALDPSVTTPAPSPRR